MDNALWYKDAVFYELYPRAFFDSDGDGHGDLRGILEKLDYLRDLGVDCLWLLPIFDSPLVDDGYDVSDFNSIQPRFGTVGDFKALIEGVHARGMRIIADLVLNHTSDQHPWFVNARSARGAPKRDWYLWNRDDQKYRDARIIFVDSQKSNWQFDPPTGEYYYHRFFPEQPDLNYDNPAVQQAMLDVVAYWLDFGLDGFRCDAVPYLFKRDGTNCENLPETHRFLKRVRRFVDDKYPGKLLLGEANQPPAETREYFGADDEFEMNFHFPLMPQIFIALKKEDAGPIIDVIRRTPSIPESAQWGIFLRNHDELTLEMVTPDEREFLWRTYAPAPGMRLNLGIRRRLAPLLDNDPRKMRLAYSLLLTLPGSPILYYGDEIGMGDDIALKDRDGIRTPMQWKNEANGGFSRADASRLYTRAVDGGEYSYRRVNVADQQREPDSLWHAIRRMIAIRKQQRVFGRGTCEFLNLESHVALTYARRVGNETLVVVNNLSSSPQMLAPGLDGSIDVLSQKQFPPRHSFALAPYEFLWLKLGRADE